MLGKNVLWDEKVPMTDMEINFDTCEILLVVP